MTFGARISRRIELLHARTIAQMKARYRVQRLALFDFLREVVRSSGQHRILRISRIIFMRGNHAGLRFLQPSANCGKRPE